jgi:hypothetical protein
VINCYRQPQETWYWDLGMNRVVIRKEKEKNVLFRFKLKILIIIHRLLSSYLNSFSYCEGQKRGMNSLWFSSKKYLICPIPILNKVCVVVMCSPSPPKPVSFSRSILWSWWYGCACWAWSWVYTEIIKSSLGLWFRESSHCLWGERSPGSSLPWAC